MEKLDAMEFKIGDIVQLKAGGPKMTVQRFIGETSEVSLQTAGEFIQKIRGFKDGDVICQWFDGSALQEGVFSKESLKLAE